VGGKMVGVDFLGVDEGSFWSGMQNNVQFGHDVVNGIIKSIVFALFVHGLRYIKDMHVIQLQKALRLQ
jgi:ABC-type transporter Mla maintaining outer membrane lipid asymmetry permease subunit MlaE